MNKLQNYTLSNRINLQTKQIHK